MCRLILSDLDHTLLRSDGSISDHTLDVLKRCRENGILFAIATARYWIGAERYIDLLKPDFEITTDGTLIHSGEKCIYSSEFTTEDTNRIVQTLLKKKPDAEITVAVGKKVYRFHLTKVQSVQGGTVPEGIVPYRFHRIRYACRFKGCAVVECRLFYRIGIAIYPHCLQTGAVSECSCWYRFDARTYREGLCGGTDVECPIS